MHVTAIWIHLLAGVAAADPVPLPASVDLEDVDRYADGMVEALRFPIGCWEVTGQVNWAWNDEGRGLADGQGAMRGEVRSGAWTAFQVEQEMVRSGREVQVPHAIGPLAANGELTPLVGLFPTVARRHGAIDLMTALIERLEAEVETEAVSWDATRGRVVLDRRIALQGQRDALVKALFPPDESVAEHVSAQLPRYRLGGGWTLEGAGLEVYTSLVGPLRFPRSEQIVLRASRGRVEVHARQEIQYEHWQPCASGGHRP